MKALLLICLLSMVACAQPMKYTNEPLVRYDKDTSYHIEEETDGYTVTILYSRYQFIPETDAVATACKQQLLFIANEYAVKNDRVIKPVNEQLLRLSFGRNGFTGITSCSGQVFIERK